MKLSIIIPVYNENILIREIINRCLEAKIPDEFTSREIIVVDDGSTDGTTELLKPFKNNQSVILHHSYINHGKGCALRVGFQISSGDVLLVQDGDLEYEPNHNFHNLLLPFVDNPEIDVVYGSRFLNTRWPDGMKFPNLVANYLFSWIVLLLYRYKLSDEATCYKVFRKRVLEYFPLISKKFEFCPEFTAKIIKSKLKIVEVPIIYHGRDHFEGKKIKAIDGIICIWTLIINFFKPVRTTKK